MVDGRIAAKKIFGVDVALPGTINGASDVVKFALSLQEDPRIRKAVLADLPPMLLGTGGYIRNWRCTACDGAFQTGIFKRTVTTEETELHCAEHHSVRRCPICGTMCEVQHVYRWRNFKRHWNWKTATFMYVLPEGEAAYMVHLELTRTFVPPGIGLPADQHIKVDVSSVDVIAPGMAARYTKPFYEQTQFGLSAWRMQYDKKEHERGTLGNPHSRCIYSDVDYRIHDHPDSAPRSESFLRYFPENFFKKVRFADPMTAYDYYAVYPSIEMLWKCGARDLVEQLILHGHRNAHAIDLCGEDAKSIFRLPLPAIRFFLAKKGKETNSERWILVYRRLDSMYTTIEEFDEMFELMNTVFNYSNEIHTASVLLRDHHVKIEKFLRYISSKTAPDKKDYPYGKGFDGAYTYWKDYVRAAKGAKMDLSRQDLFLPKDLIGKHDTANAVYTRLLIEKQGIEAKNVYERNVKRYAYTDGNFTVVIPHSTQEIVLEGKNQNNCVAGYADRHMAGTLSIVFIRKANAPYNSLVTVEMHGAECRQARTRGNNSLNAEQKDFLFRFLIEVGVRMKTVPKCTDFYEKKYDLAIAYEARVKEEKEKEKQAV